MNRANPNRVGVAFGAFLGLFHLCWALAVAFGWAQSWMDWIFKLHFIKPPYVITAFDGGTAVALVVVTAVLGYIFGWVIAWLWNQVHR